LELLKVVFPHFYCTLKPCNCGSSNVLEPDEYIKEGGDFTSDLLDKRAGKQCPFFGLETLNFLSTPKLLITGEDPIDLIFGVGGENDGSESEPIQITTGECPSTGIIDDEVSDGCVRGASSACCFTAWSLTCEE
jgi:hypothetical protein